MKGTVKFYNIDKGFGFIKEEEADNEGKTKQQVSPKIKKSNIVKNRKKTHYENTQQKIYPKHIHNFVLASIPCIRNAGN